MARLLIEIDVPSDLAVETVKEALGRSPYNLNVEAAVMDPLTIAFQFPTFAARDAFILEKTTKPVDVQAELRLLIETPSDINEHLAYLASLASGLDGKGLDVVEFGCRNGVSTTAFASTAKSVHTFDIDPNAIALMRGRLPMVRTTLGSTIDPNTHVPECDLLFIDSLHTYTQLKTELEMHGKKARKLLAFHDTMTFGTVSEDGTKPGLRAAIYEWLLTGEGQNWFVKEDFAHNNGVLVLARKS